MYLVAKFVTLPSKSKTKHKASSTEALDSAHGKSSAPPADNNAATYVSTIPSITTPSTPLETQPGTPNVAQPLDSEQIDPSGSTVFVSSDSETVPPPAPIPATAMQTHDEDGALIHCIAVSSYCFKHGRVTVPPQVAFAMSGFDLGLTRCVDQCFLISLFCGLDAIFPFTPATQNRIGFRLRNCGKVEARLFVIS